jgi:hypothetical protein
VNTRIATKKNQLSVSDYYSKMTHYVDELTTLGSPLSDDELVAYLLADLDEEYNPMFTTVVAHVDPVSPSNLYAQLLSFEQHTHLQAPTTSGSSSSAMTASHNRGFPGRGASGSDHDHAEGRGRFSRGRGRFFGGSHPQCQVCLKIGHTTNNCWHRFDEDYVSEPRTAVPTSRSGNDNAWYMNSGATVHRPGTAHGS